MERGGSRDELHGDDLDVEGWECAVLARGLSATFCCWVLGLLVYAVAATVAAMLDATEFASTLATLDAASSWCSDRGLPPSGSARSTAKEVTTRSPIGVGMRCDFCLKSCCDALEISRVEGMASTTGRPR